MLVKHYFWAYCAQVSGRETSIWFRRPSPMQVVLSHPLKASGGTQRQGNRQIPLSFSWDAHSPASDLRAPGFQTFRFRLNYTTGLSHSPAFQTRNCGTSQRFTASWDNSSNKSPLISTYLYGCYWLCFSGEPWTHTLEVCITVLICVLVTHIIPTQEFL